MLRGTRIKHSDDLANSAAGEPLSTPRGTLERLSAESADRFTMQRELRRGQFFHDDFSLLEQARRYYPTREYAP